ncbi:MAG: YpmA family protein [Desulfitobacteriaceae bacterium]|nr:YpmA family protein [Desulfitobacteriaceae bacterium]MDD4752197.1 YpmA family protein [Desulfitobacteriaceae bacterium]
MEKTPEGKLELIATKNFSSSDELYKVVDFLNKSLKQYNLMFGLKKSGKSEMVITIYEV